MALSEKGKQNGKNLYIVWNLQVIVWVGAAPTGKKVASALKRKPSADDVSMQKGKKAKGGPVVGCKYIYVSIILGGEIFMYA